MQKYYTQQFIRQLAGMIVGNGAPPRVRSLRNNRGQTYQELTFAVTAAGAGAGSYELVFNVDGYPTTDTTVVVNFDAAHTEAQLAEAIVLGINTNPTIYQDAGVAQLDPGVANGIKFVALQRGIDILTAVPTITPSGAGPGTISAPVLTNSAVNEQIGYGLFVGQYAGYAPKDASLPVAGDDTMSVSGVTLITRWNERDKVGQDGKSGYEPFDVMDVVTKTVQNKAIVVRCVESDIAPGDTIYVSVDANTRGWATTTAAGNIALPNATVEEGSYAATELDGAVTIQVSLN